MFLICFFIILFILFIVVFMIAACNVSHINDEYEEEEFKRMFDPDD